MTLWSTGARPGAAFRFRPKGPSWDLPFLRRLAGRLADHPRGSAVLIETSGITEPLVVPGSPELEEAIERAAFGLPGVLERLRPAPADPHRGAFAERFAVLSPSPPTDPGGPMDDGTRKAFAGREAKPLGDGRPEESCPIEGPVPDVLEAQWHWFSTGGNDLAVRVRIRVSAPRVLGAPKIVGAVARICAQLPPGRPAVRVAAMPASRRRRRSWTRGSLDRFWEGAPFSLSPLEAAHAVRPRRPMPALDDRALARHVVVLGASGSGKSSFLARLAIDRISRGQATVVLDVHGDLGPAISAGLDPAARARLTAVDVTLPAEEIPGVALFQSARPDERERESAHLVASLRHLSHDGSEVYWGNRLEQVFDVFVRLVEEEHGGFADLYELLSDPARREAARATTRRPVAARFLDDLPALLRRN
ncbi:MAG TPA: DUF87 domain-containing protein, partial [Thermoplasmata archaeon]|nr:DUF87 domain-containing protein [Thermoplasmata archaeon]